MADQSRGGRPLRRLSQVAVGVVYDESHPARPDGQRRQEREPAGAVVRSDVPAQHFTAAVGVDATATRT
jgi:hypothetical protein